MKIIKAGRKAWPRVYRAECHQCGAVLEYGDGDIRCEQRAGFWVTCPTCQALIAHVASNRYEPTEPPASVIAAGRD